MLPRGASSAGRSTTPTVRIEARGLRKRFGLHWIVKDFEHVFESGSRTAISGPNGSGKSTLVKLLCGQLVPSAGEVSFSESGTEIATGHVYRHVSLCGPYVELIEELTGEEHLRLHRDLRGFRQNLSLDEVWSRVAWKKRVRKQTVASYSSGMKQRLKLLIALATEASAVFLDEPTSNLDVEGVEWYRRLVADWGGNGTLIIASNEERDFVDCDNQIDSDRWRPAS